MNRILNVRFFGLLARNVVNVKTGTRDFCHVQKFKFPQNTKSSFFINPRNYCSVTDDPPEETGWMNDDLFEKVTNGDPELQKRVQLTLLELENYKLEGHLVPKKLTHHDWKEYLLINGYHSKLSYLKYLAKIEFKREKAKPKKEKKGKAYHAQIQELNLPDHIRYQLGKNAFYMKIAKRSIMGLLNTKMLGADYMDNRIIFDMGFERYMTRRQMKECGKQFLYSFARSRLHVNPLYIHVCNYPENSVLHEMVNRCFGDEIETFPFSIHRESYLDIFDTNRLVYLTPDSPFELVYHPDDIYIIGAFVDTGPKLPISFAKAKADKIRTARFPLDRYLKWKQGQKSLPLNVCFDIVADYLYYKDWLKAFKNVPRRLIDAYDEEDIETFETSNRSERVQDEKKEMTNG